MADALGIPFYHVFLMVISPELHNMWGDVPGPSEAKNGYAPATYQPKGCSDILLFTENSAMMAHNEDGGPTYYRGTALISATIVEDSGELSRWVSYAYPGYLAGFTYGFNDNGIYFSTNAITPKTVNVGGIARYMIDRSLLDSKNMDDAIARATVANGASGFNFNVAHRSLDGHIKMANVESGPDGDHSVMFMKPGGVEHYHHFNMYRRLNASEAEILDESTVHRQRRFEELPHEPKDEAEIRMFLGDTANPTFPVYRNGKFPDYLETFTTIVTDLKAGIAKIFASNPATSSPVATFSLDFLPSDDTPPMTKDF
eukprot:TRINITY_DN27029_c0_g1_i1.p1 TRINITY_DN27029_c0_g1~~TRINITY_DN27029_c0_g1_i1.p1  ORF type:complete len:314 (+),score=110.03 TRINITY_DN27029_c0_g1_i1:427-1368(+)